MDAEELGAFLRSRRDRLQPSSAGLPPAGRRRAAGLRREEVAVLAGIGVSWLARLEQGRVGGVSAQVLGRLADVLQLDDAERTHLFGLADLAAEDAAAPGPADDRHRSLVDGLEPHPAYLLDDRWEFVAWNRAEQALFPPLATAGPRPNLLRLVFGHPQLRRMMLDWHEEAVRLTQQFRLHQSRRPGAGGAALAAELRAADPVFAAAWDRHDVAAFTSTRRTFAHPAAGRLDFDHHRLGLLDRPGWQLVVYVQAAGTDSTARLARTWRP